MGESITKMAFVTQRGVSDPKDLSVGFGALGLPMDEWRPWKGSPAIAGVKQTAGGVPDPSTAQSATARASAVWTNGAAVAPMLSAMGLQVAGGDNPWVQVVEVADLMAEMGGGQDEAATSTACCIAAIVAAAQVGEPAAEAAARAGAAAAGARAAAAAAKLLARVSLGLAVAAKAAEAQLRLVGAGGASGLGIYLRHNLKDAPPPLQPTVPPPPGAGADGGGLTGFTGHLGCGEGARGSARSAGGQAFGWRAPVARGGRWGGDHPAEPRPDLFISIILVELVHLSSPPRLHAARTTRGVRTWLTMASTLSRPPSPLHSRGGIFLRLSASGWWCCWGGWLC